MIVGSLEFNLELYEYLEAPVLEVVAVYVMLLTMYVIGPNIKQYLELLCP